MLVLSKELPLITAIIFPSSHQYDVMLGCDVYEAASHHVCVCLDYENIQMNIVDLRAQKLILDWKTDIP